MIFSLFGCCLFFVGYAGCNPYLRTSIYLMRAYIHFILFVSLLSFVSCNTTQKSTAHHSRQPRFIDDIYMDGHNKNCTTTECIDRSVKYPEQKTTAKRKIAKPVGPNTGKAPVAGGAKPKTRSDADKPSENNPLRDKYAGMMGVSNKDIDNYNLYRFIDAWYGVDYRMGGTDKDGIDCSGFVQKLYTEVFGLDLVRTSYEQFSNCEHLRKADEAQEGDLVFFKTRGRRISHVGVYLMNGYFVHASTTQGIMISSLKEEYWHRHFAGVGRISK